MTLALMIYGIVLGTLLAGAAYFLDRGLRALGQPTRWAWALGMAAVASTPIIIGFSDRTPSVTPQGTSIPVDFLYEMVSAGSLEGQGSSGLFLALEQPLGIIWILSSALILLAVLWAYQRLRLSARGWEKKWVGTEEVLVSTKLGPAVLGLIRPRIVLPAWALELGGEKLEMILLHEKEHRNARDPALLTFGLLLAALTPWNPGLWWMARRLHLAVEGDCDRRVLAKGISPKSYGNLLLEVASGPPGLSALAPALAEGGQTFLERRLLMIRSTVRKHRFGAAALATLASAGLLVLACETPTPPSAMEDDVAIEEAPVTSELAEAEEGYFLVRKTGEEVEYIGSVSPDQLKLIQEDEDEAATGHLFRVKELTDDLAEAKEGAERVVRLREVHTGDPTGATAQPLIYVDGVRMSDPDALENLNPDDIESIEVLKGSAALALYGEAGENGVIQITMKH